MTSMLEAGQWIVVSWIARFTGTLSIIGSSSVIYMIISDRVEKLAKPKHRLMLMLSVFDVSQSTAVASATWPFPRSYIYGSMGNMTTCKIQYFFGTLGLTVPMYNASLCLLYLFTIKYRLQPTHFATKIEPYLHTASVLIPLILAIGPVVMNDVIIPISTPICSISKKSPFAWIFITVPSLSFLICLYSMVSICRYVNAQSRKMKQYTYGTSQTQRREIERRKTIQQAIYYTAAFFITFLFIGMRTLFIYAYPLEILKNIFYPLQGFWNFLLYIRPAVTKMKEDEKDAYLCVVIWRVIFHPPKKEENIRQKRRNIRNKMPTQSDIIKANLDADINVISEWSSAKSEESKQEITVDIVNEPKEDCITQIVRQDDQVSSVLIANKQVLKLTCFCMFNNLI